MSVQIRKPNNSTLNDEELNKLSKQELISKIKALSAHNVQLKSIINKAEQSNRSNKKISKPFDFNRYTFRRVLLKFLYLGWDYQGYATQEDTISTIEYHLFEALTKTCLIKSRQESNYHRCGRTDKGVSSYGQVISIDIRSKLSEENHGNTEDEIDYCTILNRVLPNDIQCVAWSPIPDQFSARFDCKRRTYKYFFPKGELDVDKMVEASKYLLGTHDFRNFCKMDVGNGVVEFIRNISRMQIELFHKSCNTNSAYDVYVITIEGKAFLWHQIRSIMGILFLIGENFESPELVQQLLDIDKNPRKPDYGMASEIPLNLFGSHYENEQISWQYSENSLTKVLNKLKRKWTFCSIKSDMLMCMINDLELKSSCKSSEFEKTTDFLIQGVKTKKYIPVMKRQKCDSLEEKIKHYVKRSRIEMKSTTK